MNNYTQICKRERDIFLTALMFFTRIPVPAYLGYHYDPTYLQASARYFPLVGIVVGAWAGLSYWLSTLLFPHSLAILLSMASAIMLTGAFHEDGWADFCDGFGGGVDTAHVLRIMKDSRLGTYGVLGLVFMMLLKAISLYELQTLGNLWFMLIASHSLSRAVATSVMFTHRYVREENSKTKPVAQDIHASSFMVACGIGILPLALLPAPYWLALPVVLAVRSFMLWFMVRRIGGYTGDSLGAVQQASEITLYLCWLCIAYVDIV